MKKKFKIHTLGCRTNQYESQAYKNQLEEMGFVEATDLEEASVCIVNTCTVTEGADRSSTYSIRQLANKNPHAQIFVTGCMVENEKEKIQKIAPNIQTVSNLEKENLLSYLFPEIEDLPEFQIKQFDAHTRAFVKVQDGCNSFCSYCVIPYVRGRSRSKTIQEIISEIEALVENGYKEIVLTGINIGDFDGNEKPARSLAELVSIVDQIPGVQRLRLSSIDPDEVDDELADVIINGVHTCPSMHLVLQSGSNVTLKRMNRKYTRQIFYETVDKMVQKNPDFTVTTDIIVGFPSETEADFQDTLDVMEKIHFAKVHMFPYSVRPRTRAALYKDPVPQQIIQKRKRILLKKAEEQAFSLRKTFLQRTFEVLLESVDELNPEYISGYTENFLRVKVLKKELQRNQIVKVKLVENLPDALLGEVQS